MSAVGGAQAARGLRPPRPPVQRVRHAPLPHVGHPAGRAQGQDRRRAGVRGLVGRGLDDRRHRRPRRRRVAQHRSSTARVWTSTSSAGCAAGSMEGQEKGWITKKQLGLRSQVGRHRGRRSADPDDLQAGGLRRSARRGRQARRREARRRAHGRAAIYIDEGRLAARPRPPRALGGDARHLHVVHGHDGDAATPSTRRSSGCPRASIRSTAWQVAKLRGRAAAGAATSRTRSASASSPRARGWRTSAARCRRRRAGTITVEEAMRQGRRTAAINRAVAPALRADAGPRVSVQALRLHAARTARPRAGPSARSGRRWSTPGTRGRLRPQDRQAAAEDAQGARARLARRRALGR